MSWTYDAALSTNRDKVRLMIGDTDTNNQQLSDAEIAFFLTQEPRLEFAAAEACQALIAKYARYDSDLASSIVSRFRDLARDLRTRGQLGVMKPYAGGVSQ